MLKKNKHPQERGKEEFTMDIQLQEHKRAQFIASDKPHIVSDLSQSDLMIGSEGYRNMRF